MTPVSPVLSVQPTSPPWSARQAHTSSMIEFDALSSRLTVAEVAVASAPPTRKNTSWIVSGSLAEPAAGSGVPTESRTGELTGPASKISPDTLTPVFGATTIGVMPCCGTRVAKPRPRTTVPGRVMRIGRDTLYTPGVRIRFFPASSARSIAASGVAGLATKNDDSGSDVPASAPLAQDVPDVDVCADGTNTL